MRSKIASTLLPTLVWSMLLVVPLFAVPVLMAARDGGFDTKVLGTDGHTAELIRQHKESMSPFYSVPETPHFLDGTQLGNGPATEERTEEWTFVREAIPEMELMIRPMGNRAKRIRV